ncbi:hybrid sensor histidine kinase/response regulator [Leptolyngbya sp. BL0902]|uniref:sensor histidine kinase n=1 Tax=Leptolyngbya sp. BL0902 TaxID=1115757 RepID=UPI0018E76B86|nr:hybrid sensor histidine kinase/response regulator [Leptolyngbya sp. BL0902]QQE65361.1 hybrid sensor histidine kinase/response regulator [Leptolyngbya sp. BL0902]
MAAASVLDPFNILAVDDSPDNLFLIETILDDPAYCIGLASGGQAALDLVQQRPPDLILLDVMMPDLDGYAVTQRLRQNPDLPYIPILLITAHDQSSLVQGLDAGADDFIRKPVDVNELRARVRSLLRLKRSMDAQAHMMRQRDDFVARLTHDLRTPLVAANRMLKLCRNQAFGPLPDEAHEAMGSIIDSNDHLLNMVNTLLEVYRHEAGQKTLTQVAISLPDLADTVTKALSPLATAKGLTCQFIVNDASLSRADPPNSSAHSADFPVVMGDPLELRRILTNLVGNAIKFTDQGGVEITLGQTSEPPQGLPSSPQHSGAWVSVQVQDTGIGIPPAEQQAIFQWFRQGDHRRAGHGLGLHLAQRLATLHGGTITVQSAPGQGSCFTLWLPAQATLPRPKDISPMPSFADAETAENLV